ncbi:MAG: Gfo/Idh/MocA family protein [Halobacteriaceae archaeon]
MTDELAAAVVGCGGAGANHAVGYERAGGAELVGVCDLDPERADALAAERDVPAYLDLAELLDDQRPDLVSVATDEYHHVEPTVTALEGGADVLCEKIPAHSLEGAREMVRVAERTGRALGVDYNYRHMPAYRTVREAVDAGELGDVHLLSAEAHCFGWHHALDLVTFLMGTPETASATLDDEQAARPYDWSETDELLYVPSHGVSATFRYGDGTMATVDSTMHTDLGEHLVDLSVYGEAGSVRLDGATPEDSTGDVQPGPLADRVRGLERVTLEEAFHRSVAPFVDARRSGEAPPTTGRDGLRVMRLENAVVRSARAAEQVAVA